MKTAGNLTVYSALICAVFVIGISAVIIGAADAPGMVTVFYRMTIPVIVSAPLFLHEQIIKKNKLPFNTLVWIVLAGFFFGVDMVLWSTGIKLSGAAIPTLFANMAPIWVALTAHFILKEKLTKLFWLGIVIAMMGFFTVLGMSVLTSIKIDTGALLGGASGVCYAFFMLAAQHVRKSASTIQFFWVSTASSAVVILSVNIFLGNSLTDYSINTFTLFLAAGILSQLVVWGFLNFVQGHLPASIVSPSLLMQPVITAVLAYFILGETLTFCQIAGGLLVLTGIILVHRSRQ